jgi:galactose-1-phosphate uridylyltransferase
MSSSAKDSVSKSSKKADTAAKDHPDAAYLKKDDLGLVVAKGLAVMYKEQPKNPVDFLAKWLLNYASVEKSHLQEAEHLDKVKELKDKLEYQLSVERKEAETKAHEA